MELGRICLKEHMDQFSRISSQFDKDWFSRTVVVQVIVTVRIDETSFELHIIIVLKPEKRSSVTKFPETQSAFWQMDQPGNVGISAM